jgi:hypothetical protein
MMGQGQDRNVCPRRVAGELAVSLALSALVSCGNRQEAAPAERFAELPAGALARVGNETIDERSVLQIARTHKVSLSEGRSRAIYDALMASGALQRGLGTDPAVVVATRGVLAEALLNKIKRQSVATASTADEIARVVDAHWLDLDRPEARRTVHAVVLVNASDDAQKGKAAHELAGRIAEAVKGIKDADRFLQAANQVPKAGLEVRVEKLGPVTEDGRIADLEQRPEPGKPPGSFDKDFVAAVWRLKAPGDQSAPILSPFGWHVILFTDTQPELRYPPEKRAASVREEIVTLRAKEAYDRELEELRRRTPTLVQRNAGTLMGMVATVPKER